MYGRIKQKQIIQGNAPLTCESIREELYQYIDDEARRVNVDSAKKRAVLQHMDYDNFRQMVLGANLFTVKSAELNKFSGGLMDDSDKTFNVLATGIKKQVLLPVNIDQLLPKTNLIKTQIICNSFSEFKKRFSQHYQLPLSQTNVSLLYQIIKDQNQERIHKIFSSDFDPSYLSKICQVLILVLQQHVIVKQDVNEFLYIHKLIEMIGSIKNIGIYVLKVLSKKETESLNRVVELLDGTDVKKEGELKALRPLFQKYLK